jgi:hypothetical protein
MRCSRRMWSDNVGRCALYLALLLGSAPLASAPAQPSVGAIHGTVTDRAGAPLAGVTVRLAGVNQPKTDNKGRFRIEHVAVGYQRLQATLLGFVPAQQELEVRAGETTLVQLSLERLVLAPPGPPLMARGTHVDTAPAFAQTIDEVSRSMGLALLRPTPVEPHTRELRIWVMPAWVHPYVLRIVQDGRRVTGEVIFWVTPPLLEEDDPPALRRYVGSLPVTLPRDQGCSRVTVDTLPEGSLGLTNSRSILMVCRKRFARRPDWAALLRALEAHHIWTLPDDAELPQPELIVNDGTIMEVEAWDGRRYRSYSTLNSGPAPEADDAFAIYESAERLARHVTRAPDVER